MAERRVISMQLAPAALIFTGLFGASSVFYFVVSFWSVKLYKLRADFTFANYLKSIEQQWSVLLFTLELSLVIGIVTTILGFVFAYIVRFKAGRHGQLLLFAAIITLFGGYLMKIYAWKTILGNEGVLNTALEALGLIDAPLTFLFYNPGAVVVTLVHFLLPLAILPIYSSMRGITDIEMESARDLGASGWRTLSDIVIPRCHTGLIAAFALCFLVSVGDYVTPAFVGGTISMIGSNIQDMFGRALNPPLGAATSFIMLFASFVIVLVVSASIKAWRPR
jgi:spermidine/putrescine transport system permease protein